jgi:hypothetical protein
MAPWSTPGRAGGRCVWASLPCGSGAGRRPPPSGTAAVCRRHTRVLFAGIETAEHFGPRIRRWAGRLRIADPATRTVLGDGAEWIWNQTAVQLPGSVGLLDIYHAGEHLAACAKVLYGEGTAAARAWVDAGRQALLTEGAAGVQTHLAPGCRHAENR